VAKLAIKFEGGKPKQLLSKLRQKVDVSLRPINVPFKNKWLRETARDLDKQIRLNLLSQQGEYSLYRRVNTWYDGLDQLLLLKERLRYELGAALITDFVVKLAAKISEKVLRMYSRESFESIFEFLACYVLAIKLRHGLVDGAASTDVVEALRVGL